VQEKALRPTPAASIQTSSESSPAKADRHKVHVVLQNKGGIGKSLVSLNLVQYLRESRKVQAIDLDPMNHTLAEFSGIQAKSVDLFDASHTDLKGREIDELAVAMLSEDSSFVIDNGAAGFVRFGGYLADTEFAMMLTEHGRDLIIHAVIAGGDMAAQCVLGLHTLLASFPASVPLVVWLNEHTGPIDADGGRFEEMKIYRDNAKRIIGLVRLPRLSSLFLQDFNEMIRRRLTYDEAIANPAFHVMNKQRLTMTRRALWKQLDEINL
jgi:CobQ/CobB/MinD/ParA nucleotide binding domain